MRQAVTPDTDITPERVRWFADYHATHPEWGVFHVALEDGNYECGASEPGVWEGETQEVLFMADWFDVLTEDQREELARRVGTLECLREQDAKKLRRMGGETHQAAAGFSAMTDAAIEAIAKTNPQPQIIKVPPRHAKTMNVAAAVAGWTSAASYHDELAAGRLGEQARRVYGWVLEAMAQNGGEAVTAAEALDKRVRNVNLYRARMTELFYQGALVKAPARECSVTHRTAITWKAVPPPWEPVEHRRTGALVLRPLLRESAALIRELVEAANDALGDHSPMVQAGAAPLLERAIERAREYDRAAADGYGGRTNPNARV